jgi:hypothetical protein
MPPGTDKTGERQARHLAAPGRPGRDPRKPQTPWWRRTPLDPWNVSMRVQLMACLPIGALVLAVWLLPKLFAAGWGWQAAEPWAGLLALLYWPLTWWWLARRHGQPGDGKTQPDQRPPGPASSTCALRVRRGLLVGVVLVLVDLPLKSAGVRHPCVGLAARLAVPATAAAPCYSSWPCSMKARMSGMSGR